MYAKPSVLIGRAAIVCSYNISPTRESPSQLHSAKLQLLFELHK